MSENRCIVCGWTLAKDAASGCVPGNCSFRPDALAEQERIKKRRLLVVGVTDAIMKSWDKHGDVPFPLYAAEAREIAADAIRAYEAAVSS